MKKINKLEKDISKLREVNNSLHDREEQLINRILQRHKEVADDVEKMNKRLSNLEKVYLMMYDEFDRKFEMLRENNNLFANEIKKIGGFEGEVEE